MMRVISGRELFGVKLLCTSIIVHNVIVHKAIVPSIIVHNAIVHSIIVHNAIVHSIIMCTTRLCIALLCTTRLCIALQYAQRDCAQHYADIPLCTAVRTSRSPGPNQSRLYLVVYNCSHQNRISHDFIHYHEET